MLHIFFRDSSAELIDEVQANDSGEDFGAVGKQYSQDVATAETAVIWALWAIPSQSRLSRP